MKRITFLVLSIITLIIIYVLTLHYSIDLNETDVMTLNVFDEYVESGAVGCYKDIFGSCFIKKDVTIEGNVDTNKVGNYTINYTLEHENYKKTVTRTINVVDNVSPLITVTDETIKTCPNNYNIDIKYTATDNYDLDLTDKVIKNIVDNKLRLEVSDSSGNKAIKEIPIDFIDNEKPTISLKGNQYIYLMKGNQYSEPGYIAIDNCIGDLTKDVKVSGSIDVNKEGKYILTYTVSDGVNTSEIQRTIQVYTPSSKGDKVIYLTFDDGPGAYTNELLDTLKRYNVKVTFFITGNGSDEVIKRAYNEGHTIAIHTYSHQYNEVYKSVDAYFNDLNKVQERIKRITGQETRLVRFPGGSSNTVSRITPGIMTTLAKMLENQGYKYFDWNVASSDTANISRNAIANNVIKSLRNGDNVVLQHDIKYESVKAVDQIIQYGLANGYTFKALTIDSPTAHHAINN